MKTSLKISYMIPLLAFSLSSAPIQHMEAVGIAINVPGLSLNLNQPIPVVVVDANGNTSNQTVYYDPSLGGVDINAGWAGANASVYFPSLNTGYVWYNGYWVDPAGYYEAGGKRYYVGADWNRYWNGYWQGRNHWNGDVNGRVWHGESNRGWQGEGWQRERADEWHEGQSHEGQWHDGQGRAFRDERGGGERALRGGREEGARRR